MKRLILKWIPVLLLLTFGILSASHAQSTRVRMQTTLGDIVVKLDNNRAPETVRNFLRYVDDEFYNGTVFHRVMNGFMIQGGGFTANYDKKRTRDPIKNEADNGLKNKRGTIAMARTGNPHSATAQFFINHVDNAFLDHKSKDGRGWGYTVFGEVVAGMEVVDKIADQPTGVRSGGMQNVPEKAIVIERVTVVNEEK